jgi:hypothetical protein
LFIFICLCCSLKGRDTFLSKVCLKFSFVLLKACIHSTTFFKNYSKIVGYVVVQFHIFSFIGEHYDLSLFILIILNFIFCKFVIISNLFNKILFWKISMKFHHLLSHRSNKYVHLPHVDHLFFHLDWDCQKENNYK